MSSLDEACLRLFVPARVARELTARGLVESAAGSQHLPTDPDDQKSKWKPSVALRTFDWPLLRFSHPKYEHDFREAFVRHMQRLDRLIAPLLVLLLTLLGVLQQLADFGPCSSAAVQTVLLCIIPLPLVLWRSETYTTRTWAAISMRLACHMVRAVTAAISPPVAASCACQVASFVGSLGLAASAFAPPLLVQHLIPCQLVLLVLYLTSTAVHQALYPTLQAGEVQQALLLDYFAHLSPLAVMGVLELLLRRRWLAQHEAQAAARSAALGSARLTLPLPERLVRHANLSGSLGALMHSRTSLPNVHPAS